MEEGLLKSFHNPNSTNINLLKLIKLFIKYKIQQTNRACMDKTKIDRTTQTYVTYV